MAVRQLKDNGYEVIPVNPAYDTVEGIPTVPNLSAIEKDVGTLTVYVNPYQGKR